MISKLSAKYQFCAIHTAENTDGIVTGGGYFFAAGYIFALHRYRPGASAGYIILHGQPALSLRVAHIFQFLKQLTQFIGMRSGSLGMP